MSRLDLEIDNIQEFFRNQFQNDCPSWSQVLLVEAISSYYENGKYKLPRSALLTKEEYKARFEILLSTCTWINFNALGIFQNSLVINLEYPRDRKIHNNKDMVAINLSGPCLISLNNPQLEWNLANKITLI
jgi:hypothetical protein